MNKFKDFNKIIYDFLKDLLITFPDILENKIDSNLLHIINNYNQNNYENDDENDNENDDVNDDEKDDENDDVNDHENDLNDKVIEQVFNYCCTIYPERFFDILYQNKDIFTDVSINTSFLPGIDFKILWNENISDITRESIWKYLQLILFSIVTNIENKSSFGNTAQLFEAIDENEFKNKLEDTIKNFEIMLDLFKST